VQKMKSLNSGIISLASMGLLLLGACSKEVKTTSVPVATPVATAPPAIQTKTVASAGNHLGATKGGQVVESGKYHLELVPEQESTSTHLDFYLLQGDKHEIIPNAKVTADLQSPDGKQKSLTFNYDAKDKHYTALVNEKTVGRYQVKVTATIGSEKVDGRFNFER
jgi:hypothetical protein